MSANDGPLPVAGVLFAVQAVIGCLRRNSIPDAMLVLNELAAELTVDSVNEAAVERQYVEVH